MKALFIDFEDSFSFNVVQEMTSVGFEVEVVNWKDFERLPVDGVLVLGPGPGHPDDYQAIFPLVEEWLQNERPYFGVCLGHQILWRIEGEEVLRSKNPLHGQKVKLHLGEEWAEWLKVPRELFVQRYNSLAVLNGHLNPKFTNFVQDDEVLISRSKNVLTYQFHPESVGTCFRKEFVMALYSIISG